MSLIVFGDKNFTARGTIKQFTFNAALDEKTNQAEVSYLTNINVNNL